MVVIKRKSWAFKMRKGIKINHVLVIIIFVRSDNKMKNKVIVKLI
jgi:hypothetical protein